MSFPDEELVPLDVIQRPKVIEMKRTFTQMEMGEDEPDEPIPPGLFSPGFYFK